MKIFSSKTVLEAAKARLRYIFSEFENVVVSFSGGKDSTVLLNVTLEVARELNRLPLTVMFIDQEAEWQGTIDYVRSVMYDPEVRPMWFQIPMVITNNASSFNRFSYCWNEDEKDKWVHQKDPISIKANNYGTDRFHDLFEAILKVEFAGQKTALLGGVRTEEAPKRRTALTGFASYKWITWGKVVSKKYGHYTIYPLYDWSYTDVWKYIWESKVKYNRVYDAFYKNGVMVQDMRISNLHHETAIQNLLLVQEIEPDTWNKLSKRIDGANTIKHIQRNSFVCPKEHPPMFETWEEYAMHLIEHLIQDEANKIGIKKKIKATKDLFNQGLIIKKYWSTIINTILSSDWDYTKFENFMAQPTTNVFKKYHFWIKTGKTDGQTWNKRAVSYMKYLTPEQQIEYLNFLNHGDYKKSD